MVKLEWNNKEDPLSSVEIYKKKYQNYFEKIFTFPYENEKRQESISKNIAEGLTNKLFWGENLETLYYLLSFFEEKIDLIYIDPPFFSGTDYFINVKDNENSATYLDLAYNDRWKKDLDSYLQMLYERIVLIKSLLSPRGLIFVHLDWHASHYIKIILDEIFGSKRFINNIVWYYYNKYSAAKNNLPRAHDDILVYSKTNNYTFNEIRLQREAPRKQLMRKMENGVLKNVKGDDGRVKYRMVTDKKIDDVWEIPCMQPASKEWTGFPNQKHHDLLERIIQIGSNQGDLFADFFVGSGTSILAAEKLKRRWIACDISEYAIYLTRKRLIEFRNSSKSEAKTNHPFEIFANLSDERKKILDSGFFEKELTIKKKV